MTAQFIELVVNQGGREHTRHRLYRINGRHDRALARTFQGHDQLALVTDGVDLGPFKGANLLGELMAQGGWVSTTRLDTWNS